MFSKNNKDVVTQKLNPPKRHVLSLEKEAVSKTTEILDFMEPSRLESHIWKAHKAFMGILSVKGPLV